MRFYKKNAQNIVIGVSYPEPSDKNNWLEDSTDSVISGMIDNGNDTFSVPEKTTKEIVDKMIADGEAIIEAHIQAPINAYNEANGTKFAHAHSCANYKDEVGYTHQVFCQQAWSFNVAVWEAGRLIQIDVLAGTIPAPTEAEFIAMLPVFGA